MGPRRGSVPMTVLLISDERHLRYAASTALSAVEL